MKLSDLTVEDAARYAVLTEDDPDAALFPHYLEAAKQYVLSYTGLTLEKADLLPDLSLAALVLFADMTRNKEATVASDKANQVLQSILGMYSVNLL